MRACLLLASFLLGACEHRATTSECNAIVDRIVDLELIEQGFRDPVLGAQKRAQMRRELQTQIRDCIDQPIRESALQCVHNAQSTEEITHRCLR